MPSSDNRAAIRSEFAEAVNMAPKELEEWLATDENWGHDPLKDG